MSETVGFLHCQWSFLSEFDGFLWLPGTSFLIVWLIWFALLRMFIRAHITRRICAHRFFVPTIFMTQGFQFVRTRRKLTGGTLGPPFILKIVLPLAAPVATIRPPTYYRPWWSFDVRVRLAAKLRAVVAGAENYKILIMGICNGRR